MKPLQMTRVELMADLTTNVLYHAAGARQMESFQTVLAPHSV